MLLTSVTTIAGLVPLLFERSQQAQIIVPVATSIVFGLLASTVLLLVVLPSMYAILATLASPPRRTTPAAEDSPPTAS